METAMSSQLFEQFHYDAKHRIASLNSELIIMTKEFMTYTRLPMYSSMRYHELTLNSGGLKNDIRQLELYFYELIKEQSYLSSITFIDNNALEVFKIDRKGISSNLQDLSLDKQVMLLSKLDKEKTVTTTVHSNDKINGFIVWIPVFVSSHTRYGLMRFELDHKLFIDKVNELLSLEEESACVFDKTDVLIESSKTEGVCKIKDPDIWKVEESVQLPGLDWKLRLLVDKKSLLKEVSNLKNLVFIFIFPVVALASLLFTLLFSRHIANDIRRLVAAAKSIGEGKSLEVVPLSRRDELGTLALQLKKSSELIEENKKALEDKNSELEAFSYTLAHDLRSPLRSIASFGQILQEESRGKLDSESMSFLERIIQASNRMSILIEDILNLSRVAKNDLRISRVSLSDMAQTIIEQLKGRGDKRKFNVIIKNDLFVNGDIQLLGLMLENLLGNAWKYTGKNILTEIEFGSETKDGLCVYFIRDNGVGFDMKYVDKLFQPFQRLHVNTEFEGTGIGLASVRRMIGRHNGRVWIESIKDKGTTVYFTLWETPATALKKKGS
jgi:signal transduction histidine kinase